MKVPAKKKRLKIVIAIVAIALTGYVCKDSARAEKEKHPLVFGDLSYTENPGLNETAKLIGAKPLPEGSALLAIANTSEYQKYSEQINSAWSNFENKHLNLVDRWVKDHPKPGCGENLFYPFSGPDLLHAIKFYPDAETIHMFALERLGGLPQPDVKHPAHEAKKLFNLIEAIKSSLDYHYFITSYMSGQVGENEYSGVIGIMLFALARLDMQVLDAYFIHVNKQGKLEKLPADISPKKASAVAIFFKKQGSSTPRVVVYFKGDASDTGLEKTPELRKYLSELKNYSTLLKAASYLMYDKTFDDMRSQVLSQSKCVLSDSSGIPYHYFRNGHWKVKLYGVYKGPLSYFKNRFDPVLFSDMKSMSEELPFDYGYRRGEGMSHIIFSERDSDYPFYSPSYDGSSVIGETTSWNSNQFYYIIKPAEADIQGRLQYKENDKKK